MALLEVDDLQTSISRTPTACCAPSTASRFDIEAGETVAIVGESGCGKSVTAMSILRLDPGAARRDRRARSASRAATCCACPIAEMRAHPRQRDQHDLPGADDSLNPVLTVGRQIGETLRLHQGLSAPAARAARGRDAGAGRHSGAGAPGARISAPAFRRHAPARDDRDGARLQPETADRRRADDRARRHHPGADPRSDARAASAGSARRSC